MASPINPLLPGSRRVGLLRLRGHGRHPQTVFELEYILLYPLNSISIILIFVGDAVHLPVENIRKENINIKAPQYEASSS